MENKAGIESRDYKVCISTKLKQNVHDLTNTATLGLYIEQVCGI